jgi:hypothetical protein
MRSLDHAGDAVDLVPAAVGAVRFVEHGVFVEDLIDRGASTHGGDLTRDRLFSAVADLQAATAGLEPRSRVLRRLSMLSAPAPNAAICRSPPAIITFLRKWIIWFWSAKLL